MRTHVKVLGWLQIAMGVLDLFLALLVLLLFFGLGVAGVFADVPLLSALSPLAGTVIGVIVVVTALPNLLAGFGLLAYEDWGRILAIVLALLNVFKVPWGTLFAGYCLWVLFHDETRAIFARGG